MALKKRLDKSKETELQDDGEGLRDTMEMDAPPPPKKAPTSRLLLLLLLLVVVAGAGYFYLIGLPAEEPAPPPRRPAAPVKQAIAVPQPAPAPPSAPAAAPVPAGGTSAAPASASAAPAGAPAKDPAPATTQAMPAPPAPAAPAKVTAAAAPPSSQQAPVAPAAAAGKYRVDAGSYLVSANRVQVEKIIRRLGFEPQASPVKRSVEMVRLRIGVFPPAEAQERLRELKGVAPAAFTLPQGDRVALYAGSYHDLDRARTFADGLYERGFRAEEETANVPMTLQRLTFGSFADRGSAEEAAAKVRAAGIQAAVIPGK